MDATTRPPNESAAAGPDPLLGPWLKGFPPLQAPLPLSELAGRGWQALGPEMPMPLALLRRAALTHNIAWMQRFAAQRGLVLAPHGKTTMSPQLFRRQLDAGAWGLSFANVQQLRIGVHSGVRRALIANQLLGEAELGLLAELLRQTPGLRVASFADSIAQCQLLQAWQARQPAGTAPLELLLELGSEGGRCGVREFEAALQLARHVRAAPGLRLVGLAFYEGLGARGEDEADRAWIAGWSRRSQALLGACEAEELFELAEDQELLISAGGSALFDLVCGALRPRSRRRWRGLLRSGCYITHDHGLYKRLVDVAAPRIAQEGLAEAAEAPEAGLQGALEVWCQVLSCPEPGLALLGAGRRDLSHDQGMPVPIAWAPLGQLQPGPAPAGWRIEAMNDQHAYLRWEAQDPAIAVPAVGDRIGLGISHPCTTFDKWTWLPIVEGEDYRIVDAVLTYF